MGVRYCKSAGSIWLHTKKCTFPQALGTLPEVVSPVVDQVLHDGRKRKHVATWLRSGNKRRVRAGANQICNIAEGTTGDSDGTLPSGPP